MNTLQNGEKSMKTGNKETKGGKNWSEQVEQKQSSLPVLLEYLYDLQMIPAHMTNAVSLNSQ